MNGTYILDAVRTPIGRHGRALAGTRPDDLAPATAGPRLTSGGRGRRWTSW
jgi:acetyl-CoA acetyltransferase